MKLIKIKKSMAAFGSVFAISIVMPAHAAIIISEVSPWSSGNSAYAADWFELTNTGNAAVDITGWKMDDSSNAFASAVALRGVTSLGAGESAIFLESNSSGSNDAGINSAFVAAWFGNSAPANLLVGNYGGSGVGLSTSADAVNLFTASGTWVAGVSFGASTTYVTFDNAAGVNGAISTLSAAGVNGAFTAYNGSEIGSPGVVPVPAAAWLMGSALLGLGGIARRQRDNSTIKNKSSQ